MKKNRGKLVPFVIAASMLVLGACGGSSGDDYSSYSTAFSKVTANGGMESDFDVSVKMDGSEVKSTGNFKLDSSEGKNLLLYEIQTNGEKVTQFSDGEYLYTESADGRKTRYKLGNKPSGDSTDKKEAKDSQGTFNTEKFLQEFSSFLEAGKIKEMGLMDPLAKNVVSSIKKNGNDYEIDVSNELTKRYINTMIENESKSGASETIKIENLTNFKYTAKTDGSIVTGVTYSGTMDVKVPASYMESGQEGNYAMDFVINITFKNPGKAVSVEIPSTDGFEDV